MQFISIFRDLCCCFFVYFISFRAFPIRGTFSESQLYSDHLQQCLKLASLYTQCSPKPPSTWSYSGFTHSLHGKLAHHMVKGGSNMVCRLRPINLSLLIMIN